MIFSKKLLNHTKYLSSIMICPYLVFAYKLLFGWIFEEPHEIRRHKKLARNCVVLIHLFPALYNQKVFKNCHLTEYNLKN